MSNVSARLVGDLVALAGAQAPVMARIDQIRDVLGDHGIRMSADDDVLVSLARGLDAIAAQVVTAIAGHLQMPTRPVTAVSLTDGAPPDGHVRVHWRREDGRAEQRWVVDVPRDMLRRVADDIETEHSLDVWICEHGVLQNPTVVEIDEDVMSFRRTTPDWLDSDTRLDCPESWPEGTIPVRILD